MRKVICILLVMIAIVWPRQVFAGEFKFNLNFVRQDDGMTCGELWYNQKMIWRLSIVAGGAKPVSGSYNTATTFLSPDIINGLFLIKVQ